MSPRLETMLTPNAVPKAKPCSLPKIAPMEARIADALPSGDGWQFEPKWDGFRCLMFRNGDRIELVAKSGKPLTRFFPEMAEAISSVGADCFVLDGELLIPDGETFSFDALQMRLHPAESRIRKLARETPSRLVLFDMPVAPGGVSLIAKGLPERRAALEKFHTRFGKKAGLLLSPFTRNPATAKKWLSQAGGALDGVIAKKLAQAYACGERAMLKVKRLRTADCVVGGFRYAETGGEVGSLLLGLYNKEGKLDHVGFTSGFAALDRTKLTAQLETLKGGPGFTGNAPGGPSRWSTERSAEWVPLKHKLIAEVRYDHVSDSRFRHGTKFLRWRPDKSPKQCTFEQIEQARGTPVRALSLSPK